MKRVPLFILWLLIASCAQVVRPTGGARDTTPPVVLSFTPENKTLNFTGSQFSFLFDEYFTVKDPNNQWIISPPLKALPEYKIKGKELKIIIADTLKPNTTYSFNFGKSIADVNEGNVLSGFSYIFSTGTFIDSLQLSGSVTNLLNNTAEKGVLVMLYDTSRVKNDSVIYKQLPDYFGLSDASGNYTINYIKEGAYKVIALKDANNNYLFDSFEELIGFSDSLVTMRKNETRNLQLFKEEEHKLYVKSKSSFPYGVFGLTLNKPAPDFSIKALHKIKDANWATMEYSKQNDTLSFWLNDFTIDTLKLQLSNKNIPFDTVEFAVLPKEKFIGKGTRPVPTITTITSSVANNAEKDFNEPIRLKLNNPSNKVITDSIKLYEGKSAVKFTLNKTDSIGRVYTLNADFLPDSSYQLTICPKTFTDCFGYTNDSLQINFKSPNPESLGSLFLSIAADSAAGNFNFPKETLLFQLLNEKGEVLRTQVLKGFETLRFLNIKPATYKARIIIDKNNNKKWDTGNYLKRKQPETILFMGGSLNLRANWELEEEWVPNFKN